MTATDELRRLLDERGVRWWAGEDERKTLWESNGLTWEYFNDENGDAWLGFLGACEQDITPAQAIAATLGDVPCLPYFWTADGTLHIELPKLPESISVRLPDQRDREVGSARTWQYTRGSGTCHIVKASRKYVLSDDTELFEDGCSVCNCYIGEDDNYCSNCGAKIVDTEACQTDTDGLDSGHVQNLSAYDAGYRDGSIHYELEHCPACKNIADLQEALDENAKLRELIVRCCDCESAREHYEGMDVWWCGFLAMYVGSGDFCCWGKKREDA